MNKLITTATTLALLSAAAFSPTVLAEGEYSVSYNPAQIYSMEGMRSLHQKILTTAKNYCPRYNEKGQGITQYRQVKTCRADVVEDLVEKINKPAFTAYVERQGSRVQPMLLADGD